MTNGQPPIKNRTTPSTRLMRRWYLSIARYVGSLSKSGTQRGYSSTSTRSLFVRKSHSKCAQGMPRLASCGSPSASECAWCARCVATQSSGPPCSESTPHNATTYSSSTRQRQAAMRQQTVIAERHSHSGNEVQEYGNADRPPRKERRDENAERSNMNDREGDKSRPVSLSDTGGHGHRLWVPSDGFFALRGDLRRSPLFQLRLGHGQKRIEGGLIAHRQVGKCFSIQRNAALL